MIGWLGTWRRWRALVAAVALGVLMIALVVLVSGDAQAHGTMQSPPSRTYTCRFLDNPERPTSPACRAAIAAGGVQPVYDWNEVNIPDAAGRHRQIIPDGRLCSAGRDKYRGFDLARTDWPATRVPADGSYTFRMAGSAPHRGTIDLYLTRAGYDPRRPPRWSDLERTPFLSIPTSHDSHRYEATAKLPSGRSGRHLIYAIWQRTDSPEAFYSCSDVLIGGSSVDTGAPDPVPMPSHAHDAHPTVTPTTPPVPVAPPHHLYPATPPSPTAVPPAWHDHAGTDSSALAWRPFARYAAGVRVSHDGKVWECIQAHMSLPGWDPAAVAALWRIAHDQGSDQLWQPRVAYSAGTRVNFEGVRYVCIQRHTSLPGWEPASTPALWRPE